MKGKLIISTIIILMFALIGVASYTFAANIYTSSTFTNLTTNGTPISTNQGVTIYFQIDDAIVNLGITDENMNVFYYKVFVPNDNDDQWNFSKEFMERKPTAISSAWQTSNTVKLQLTSASSGFYLVYVCCNIQKGDLLYTANASNPDGSFNITLAGTLTNNYGQNWKSRVYNSQTSSWGNVNVGASTNPDVYNRRAKLHSDGTMVGYAMESVNVTVPTLIKIYKV